MSPTPAEQRGETSPDPTIAGLILVLCLYGLMIAAGIVLVLEHPWHPTPKPLAVEVTVTGAKPSPGHQLTAKAPLEMVYGGPRSGTERIRVNSSIRRQQIQGFGSAMTDSSAWLLEKNLSKQTKTRVFNALFSTAGIHMTNVRIPIAASDFTATGVPYSYENAPPATPGSVIIRIAHDNAYIIPALNKAAAIDRTHLNFIATAWSAPAWMKTNDKLSNKANTGVLKPADYESYAKYIANFLVKYEDAGIEIGSITPANEPTVATSYPGMNISATAMDTLITRYLVPTLRSKGLETAVYGNDLGFQNAAYARTLATGTAARDLTGIAWHCYYGSPSVMSRIHRLNPKLGVLMTECSPGIATESLSEIVIESLRNEASVVDLWNIALNDRGGPVQPPNHGCPGCYGLVRIDTANRTAHYTDAFYDLGQASKFIEPGAVRVRSTTHVSYDYTGPGKQYVSADVDDAAVRNPDGTFVLMAYNNATVAKRISVMWGGYSFSYRLGAGETATFRWKSGRLYQH